MSWLSELTLTKLSVLAERTLLDSATIASSVFSPKF